MSKAKEQLYPLTDPRILGDHLRLATDIVRDCGQAAQVAAAVYIAAADGLCFVRHEKLAGVACCSRSTVIRALSADRPLVQRGWLKNFGRQPFSSKTNRKRRTCSVQLTRKAIDALERRYHILPRAVVLYFDTRPLSWSERVIVAECFSRFTLVERLAEDGLGVGGEGRDWPSIRELVNATGLVRSSVILARASLLGRGLLMHDDNGTSSINDNVQIPESELPAMAVDVLRSTKEPPREFTPAPTRKANKPKAMGGPSLTQEGTPGAHQNVTQEGVRVCNRKGSESDTGRGPNVTQRGSESDTCNDLNLVPKPLNPNLRPKPVTKTATASVAVSVGSQEGNQATGGRGELPPRPDHSKPVPPLRLITLDEIPPDQLARDAEKLRANLAALAAMEAKTRNREDHAH